MSDLYFDSVNKFIENHLCFENPMSSGPFILNETQIDFLSGYEKKKYFSFYGARRTGKTTIASIVLIYNSLYNKNRSALICPNYNMLYHNRNMIMDIFGVILDSFSRKNPEIVKSDYKIHFSNISGKKEIVFPNDSRILLCSSERLSQYPENVFRGVTYDDIMVDEEGYCHPETKYRTLMALDEGHCKKLTYISS